MKHSMVVAVCVIGMVLLTGCTGKGELWRQAQSSENRFIESEEERKEILKQVQEQAPIKNGLYSETVATELLNLEKVLKEAEKQGILTTSNEDEEEYEEEYDEEYSEDEPINLYDACESLRSGEWKGDFSYDTNIYEDFVAMKKEDMKKALDLLEEKGYTGVCSLMDNLSEESYEEHKKVIHGISFSVMTDLDNQYVLGINMASVQLYCEKTIADYVQNNVDGSFSLDSCITGGYIERLKLVSDSGLAGENFSTILVVDIREGKAVSLEAQITSNKKNSAGKIFTEEQYDTMIRILTQVTGSEKESEKMVKNLEIKTDQKGHPVAKIQSGTVGSKTYTLAGEGTFYEDYPTYTLYIE